MSRRAGVICGEIDTSTSQPCPYIAHTNSELHRHLDTQHGNNFSNPLSQKDTTGDHLTTRINGEDLKPSPEYIRYVTCPLNRCIYILYPSQMTIIRKKYRREIYLLRIFCKQCEVISILIADFRRRVDYREMEDDGIVGWMENLRLDGGGDGGDGRDGGSSCSSSSSSILPQLVGWMESLRLDAGGDGDGRDDEDGRDGVSSSSSSSSILPQVVGWMESLRLDAGGDGDGRDGVKEVGVRGSGDGVSSSTASTLPHLLRSLTGLLRGMVLEEEEEDHEHDMASEWEDIDHDMVSEDDEDIDHDMVLEEEDIDHVEE